MGGGRLQRPPPAGRGHGVACGARRKRRAGGPGRGRAAMQVPQAGESGGGGEVGFDQGGRLQQGGHGDEAAGKLCGFMSFRAAVTVNRARGIEGTTTLPWARLQDGRSGDALTDHVVVPVVMVAAVDSCRVSGCFPVTSTSAAWVGGSRGDGGPRGSCHRGKAGRSIICRSGSDRAGDGLCGHRPWGVLG